MSTLRAFSRFARPALAVALLVLLSAATRPVSAAQEPRVFRAGAAKLDITPELGAVIVGGFNPVPSKHVHDPLHAKAIVLDDGANRIAFVVCDNVGIAREACDVAKQLIEQQSKLPAARVMISATHTHSGPSARNEVAAVPGKAGAQLMARPGEKVELTDYQKFLARRIADAVQCAINNLEPARIAWGATNDPTHVFNRRWFVGDEALRRNPFGGVDTVRMNPPRGSKELDKPAGPTDPEIPFIAVQAANGRPLALLAVYSLHYVGGVGPADISADYFGVFGQRMAELLGAERQDKPFIGIMANGTSGDINNINFREAAPSKKPYEKIREVAHQLADRVFAVHQTLTFRDWVSLDSRLAELSVGTRRPAPEIVTRAKQILAQGPKPAAQRWHVNEETYATRVIQLAEGPERVEIPIQAFRIGELAVMTVPTEVFVEIGLELKSRSSLKPAFAISLANGSFGYLPTAEQHKLGGYETWLGTNRLEVDAAAKIVETLLRQVGEMQQGAGRDPRQSAVR